MDHRNDASPLPRALVVDDAPEFRELLSALLASEGFDALAVADGESALEAMRSAPPDVVVLDVGLPGIDGLETCRRLREFSDAYVVMLTGRDADVDKVIGLSVGADDYVTKPFSPTELVARVRALMRRPRAIGETRPSGRRVVGDVELDIDGREAWVRGERVELTRIQFDLLEALTRDPRVVHTRGQLLERVWGPDWFGDHHVVDVHMSNLRQKVESGPDCAQIIKTVRGVGYRISPESAEAV